MAISRNFTVKYDLAEANTVKHALEFYLKDLMNRINLAAEGDLQGTRLEAGRVETILRRDF